MCQILHSIMVRFGLRPFFGHLWVVLRQSLDLVWVIFVVCLGFLGCNGVQIALGATFIMSGLRVLVVVLAVVFVGAGELFEEVGVLDGGGDFVVAAGPFAE